MIFNVNSNILLMMLKFLPVITYTVIHTLYKRRATYRLKLPLPSEVSVKFRTITAVEYEREATAAIRGKRIGWKRRCRQM